MPTASTESKIKEIAYSLWEQEGRPNGRELEHYFQAEKIATSPVAEPAAANDPETTNGAARKTTRARKPAARTNGTGRKPTAKRSGAKS